MEEFKASNEGNHGMFKSATAYSEGFLVSIKNCVDIQQLLADIGKTTIQNKGCELEILYGMAMTLPSTKTKCKMTGRLTAREFYDIKNPILILERGTPQHKFILKYIKTYWSKNSGMTANAVKRLNKTQRAIYKNLENGKYGEELEKNPIHGVELLCKMNEDKYGYNTWWKIGIALLNSFPREVAEKIFVGWSKKYPQL